MRNRFFSLLLLNAPTKSSKSHVELVRHTRPPPSFHMLLVFDEEKPHQIQDIFLTGKYVDLCSCDIYVYVCTFL